MPLDLGLEGLKALTDETGMFQHSKYSTIDRKEGYTTDDNARALIAALRHYHVYGDQESLQLADTYLTFLFHMQRDDGNFHNL
ncbi:MAG: glycosyltransferase, partial [Candidatus Bathyarchaeia archaeon]